MANTKEIASRIKGGGQLSTSEKLGQLLDRVDIKSKFEAMLGKKAPGFMSSILSLTNAKEQLKACDPMSIIQSAAIAATLDLPINANLGFAHIVPYGGVASFQMGWRGFVQLAIRSGQFKTMNAAELYEGELISYNRITGETSIDESKRSSNKVVAYVAYFKLVTGFEKYLLMTKSQVEAHGKRYSKSFSKPGTPWQINFDAMALKTVLKMLLSKYGLLSVELQKAVTYDEGVVKETVEGEKVDYPDGQEAQEAEVVPQTADASQPKEPIELPYEPGVE
jgi:recombination protein RecT